MATQVILLERIEKLGNMGDVVAVKPGYARNYLLPQKKALRASKENVAYFETQKQYLQVENDKKRTQAQELAKTIEGLKVPIIRAASEGGQLFGSVSARDIATEAAAISGQAIGRSMVVVNQSFKTIGLFPVVVALHPEVKVTVTVNIARSVEEADIQQKTGRAVIAETKGEVNTRQAAERLAAAEAQFQGALENVLEDGALDAEKEKQADLEAKDLAKEEAKAAKASKPKKTKAVSEAPEAEEA